jgi:hypothetical protein
MNITKTALICLTLSASFAFAQGKEAKGPDAQAIDSACTTDSATAGCGGEKVGTGLLKCLWAYKKAHKDFNFSSTCKSAMEKAKADRKSK